MRLFTRHGQYMKIEGKKSIHQFVPVKRIMYNNNNVLAIGDKYYWVVVNKGTSSSSAINHWCLISLYLYDFGVLLSYCCCFNNNRFKWETTKTNCWKSITVKVKIFLFINWCDIINNWLISHQLMNKNIVTLTAILVSVN